MTRSFTTTELAAILPPHDWPEETIGPGRLYIYAEHEGKTWRIEVECDHEGGHRLWDDVCFVRDHPGRDVPRAYGEWDAVEVVKQQKTITVYVPVESP